MSARPPRILLVQFQERDERLRESLAALAGKLVVVRLEPGLGGVWSDYFADHELHRVGFPANATRAFLRPLEPRAGEDTCLSVVLGRVAFRHQLTDVVFREQGLVPVVRHAIKGLRVWCSGAPAEGRTPAIGTVDDILRGLAAQRAEATR